MKSQGVVPLSFQKTPEILSFLQAPVEVLKNAGVKLLGTDLRQSFYIAPAIFVGLEPGFSPNLWSFLFFSHNYPFVAFNGEKHRVIIRGFPKKIGEKGVPPGELTFCHGKIHHAINGKIHYFYGHFQ